MLGYSNRSLVEVSLRQLSSVICGQAMETVSTPWRWKGEAYEKALGHLTGTREGPERTARDLSNEY